jgi:hypothetical protein
MYLRHVNLTEIDIVIGFLLSFFELEELDWLIICLWLESEGVHMLKLYNRWTKDMMLVAPSILEISVKKAAHVPFRN